MQTMGMSLASSAALSFLLTSALVSPRPCLRSLWPKITWVQPTSTSIPPEISPVYAPDASQNMSCAPRPTGEPSSTWSIRLKKTKGGQTATCTSVAVPRPDFTPSARAMAVSAVVGFNFQLPAINRVRMRPFLLQECRSIYPPVRLAAADHPSDGRSARAGELEDR